jgi:hypothetical protein
MNYIFSLVVCLIGSSAHDIDKFVGCVPHYLIYGHDEIWSLITSSLYLDPLS